MQNWQEVQQAVSAVRARAPEAAPRIAIVLGTGLGGLAEALKDVLIINFTDIPAFPVSTVPSHCGRFLLGILDGVPVVLQQGRCHIYEGYTPAQICMGVRVMAGLGAETLIVTNAAGCLVPQWDTGDLMVITDHINQTGRTPLAGPNHDAWGERFPSMHNVYDPHCVRLALETAARLGQRLERGVYVGVPGPQMETPAETRLFRQMGAHAVGMSTVLEVIAARHLGMRVCGISCLTNKNLPDCMTETPLEEIIRVADAAGQRLTALVRGLVERL